MNLGIGWNSLIILLVLQFAQVTLAGPLVGLPKLDSTNAPHEGVYELVVSCANCDHASPLEGKNYLVIQKDDQARRMRLSIHEGKYGIVRYRFEAEEREFFSGTVSVHVNNATDSPIPSELKLSITPTTNVSGSLQTAPERLVFSGKMVSTSAVKGSVGVSVEELLGEYRSEEGDGEGKFYLSRGELSPKRLFAKVSPIISVNLYFYRVVYDLEDGMLDMYLGNGVKWNLAVLKSSSGKLKLKGVSFSSGSSAYRPLSYVKND